jgi:hypothetical protein
MFASTNAYLNGAVADLWQEIAEQSERLGLVERSRNPYPHVYDAGREKWYVQRPDSVHMLQEARLLRAPTQEVVPWQSWKYFHHLQNYLDGAYLSHQVYSYVFSTRALGGLADGGDARDTEDFKAAKLTLQLKLNPRGPAGRLFVYLQTFQTLRVRDDGRVTKACEYRDGKWVCADPEKPKVREPDDEQLRQRRREERQWMQMGPSPSPMARVESVPRFLQDDRAQAQARMKQFTRSYKRGSAEAVRSMWR